MHARMGTFQVPPDAVNEMTRLQREVIVPAAREAAGFKGILSLVNRDSGKVISLTLWDSEEALRSSEERAGAFRAEAAFTSQGEVVGVERFEVDVFEMAQ